MSFLDKGWAVFPQSPQIIEWIGHVTPLAEAVLRDPAYAKWHRYGGTWFAGVNVVPNDESGALPDGPPLSGPCIDFIRSYIGTHSIVWDRGQLSVCFPGYPQPTDGELEASLQYRRKRDAAHVDGLHATGSQRRRFLREHHAFILGIPLDRVDHDMSPLVVWEGSHKLMKRALRDALADTSSDQ